MKKTFRMMIPLTAFILSALFCSGCSEPVREDAVVKLKMVMINMGTGTEGSVLVEERLNEYIEPLIGVNVEFVWVDMATLTSQVNLMIANEENIDILPYFGSYVSALYAQDAIMPITDLVEEYGQGIAEGIGEEYMQAGCINGEQYLIPISGCYSRGSTFLYRKDIAEKYDLDFSGVRSLEDLLPILEKLHEVEPELSLIISNNPNEPMLTGFDWDGLGDEYGVLMEPTESTEVTDLFESEEYRELCTFMHDCYLKGYIQENAATTSDNIVTLMSAGDAFGMIYREQPDEPYEEIAKTGYDLDYVVLRDYMATTQLVTNGVMLVPSVSQHSKEAVRFLNLMYTDPEVVNLINYGIEDVHYQIVGEDVNKAVLLFGENSPEEQYINPYHLGNTLIGLVWDYLPDDYNEQVMDINENSEKSLALGFTYDSREVSDELAAVQVVAKKYRKGLECGSLDPETELPRFIEELKRAGIDRVIEEKQKQLDAWMASER